MKRFTITPEFVEFIPAEIQEGVLYISDKYATAIHKCCCGCGHEVVTPLSSVSWKLYREGDTVTLHPSIGNWNFQCQSHYWIRRNKIIWASSMSMQQIRRIQELDKQDMERHITQSNEQKIRLKQKVSRQVAEKFTWKSELKRLWRWLREWWKR